MSGESGYSFASWATLRPITTTLKDPPDMVVVLEYEVFEQGQRVGSFAWLKSGEDT